MTNNTNYYIEEFILQEKKHNQNICGDYYTIKRTPFYTDVVLCDGLGSGFKANISAIAYASRIIELINNNMSFKKVCKKMFELINRARVEDIPYSTFTMARIYNSGEYKIYNYENSKPIIISEFIPEILQCKNETIANEIVEIYSGRLQENEHLIFATDGLTQAGLGYLPNYGWGEEGFIKYIKMHLNETKNIKEILKNTLEQTYILSGNRVADDTTIIMLTSKKSNVLNIMTGPPLNSQRDVKFVNSFNHTTGKKVICGSQTSELVARVLGKEIKIKAVNSQMNMPPEWKIEGFDLVTEGASTLNQTFNILEEDSKKYNINSVVSKLAILMKEATQINFFMGIAQNQGHNDISFMQLGVLKRIKIVPLLVEKLINMGKIVTLTKM